MRVCAFAPISGTITSSTESRPSPPSHGEQELRASTGLRSTSTAFAFMEGGVVRLAATVAAIAVVGTPAVP